MMGDSAYNPYPLTTGAEGLYRSLKALWDLATIGGLKFALHKPVMPDSQIHPDWEGLAETLDLNLTGELERYEFVYTIGRSNAEAMSNCWVDSYKKCEQENQKIRELWRALRGGLGAIQRRALQSTRKNEVTMMQTCDKCPYRHPRPDVYECQFEIYSGWPEDLRQGDKCFMSTPYRHVLRDHIGCCKDGLRKKYQTNINAMRLCLNSQEILTEQLKHIDEDRPLFPRFRDRSYFMEKTYPDRVDGKNVVYYVTEGAWTPEGLGSAVPPTFIQGKALDHPARLYPDGNSQPDQSLLRPGVIMPEGMIEVVFPSSPRGVSEIFDCTSAVIMTESDFEYILNHRGFARMWIMSRYVGDIPSHARTGADRFAQALEAHANRFAEGSGQFASISAGTEGNGQADRPPVNVNEALRAAPGAIIRGVPAPHVISNWIRGRFDPNIAPGNIIGVMDGSIRAVPNAPPSIPVISIPLMTHEALMGMAENMGLLYEEELGTPGVIPVSDEELRRRITNHRNDGLDQVITRIINKVGNQTEIKIRQLDGITRAISPISKNGIRRIISNMNTAGLVTIQSLRQQFEVGPYVVENEEVCRSPYGRYDVLKQSPVFRVLKIVAEAKANANDRSRDREYKEGVDWNLVNGEVAWADPDLPPWNYLVSYVVGTEDIVKPEPKRRRRKITIPPGVKNENRDSV